MNMTGALYGITLSSLLLTGCFSDSKDPDQGGGSTVQVSGVALDAYIAGATVYADLNNNGKRDAFEPSAFTDANGYFSVGPNGENYCIDGPARYCLRLPTSQLLTRLRVHGGFDLLTGEIFTGEMSRTINIPSSDSTTLDAITPFTSLIAAGISGENNYWLDFDEEQAVMAYNIHQSIAAITRRLLTELEDNNYGLTSGNEIHTAIQMALINDDWAASNTEQVQQNWQTLTRADFERVIQDALEQLGVISSQVDTLAALTSTVQDTLADANPACPSGDQNLTPQAEASATIRGTYALWIALDGQDSLNETTQSGFMAALNALHCEDDDAQNQLDYHIIAELIADYSGDTGTLNLDAARFIGDLSGIANSRLFLVDQRSDSSAEFIFNGDETFSLTVQSGGELDFGEFGDCEAGERCEITINGTWQQIGNNQIILILSAFGGSFEQSASLRLGAGTDGTTQWVFAFSYDGKRASYTSNTGFEPQQP